MSVKIMSLVWEHAPYSEGSLLVLLALADWANDDGMSWPSVPKLAHKARLQRRRTQYIIRKLQKDGFLDIEEGGGRKKQHKYTLNLEKIKGAFIAPIEEINSALSDIETVHFGAERAHSETQTAHSSAPDPLVEPLEESLLEPPYSGAEFLSALAAYDSTAKERKVKESPEQRRMLFRKLERWGEAGATQALEDSVASSWRGVFEPKNGANNGTHQDIRRVSAAERNASQLSRNLAVVEELRRQSG